MKSKFFFFGAFNLIVVICGITACSQQTNNNAPTQAMASATQTKLSDLGEGHAIYMRQCSQCHEAKLPETIPSKAWHVIVPGMAWNAGLSKEEEAKVHTYIIAASEYSKQRKR